jgi:hypothetical protein
LYRRRPFLAGWGWFFTPGRCLASLQLKGIAMRWIFYFLITIGVSCVAEPCFGQRGFEPAEMNLGRFLGGRSSPSHSPDCPNGECPNVRQDQRTRRQSKPATYRPTDEQSASVVPVWIGSKASQVVTGGVYVGIIGGRGVTLTCWHVVKHDIHNVGGQIPLEVLRDQYDYDLAAIFTSPLSVPAVQIGSAPSAGDAVTIVGYPGGRLASHDGRVSGYEKPDGNHRWGDLVLSCPSQDGDSGGPVLSRGRLVGLLWGTEAHGGAGSRAVPIAAIVDFLRRLRDREESPDAEIASTDEDGPAPPPGTPAPVPDDLTETNDELASLRAEISELRALLSDRPHGQPVIDYAALAAELEPLLSSVRGRRNKQRNARPDGNDEISEE